ncbi:MAG TPA: glycoside hydrolase [Firmicutes bacterium]|jgi:hypothetical protein|nr:glycoside hydrolase [Bacillota bacterium]
MKLKKGFAMLIFLILFLLSFFTLYAAENSNNGMVLGQSVNLRTGPDQTAESLMVLNEGLLVKVIEKIMDWYKIALSDGREGWIYQDYLTTQTSIIQNRIIFLNQARQLTEFAKNYLGTRYAYGGTESDGFDCSGYTMFVYGKFGYKLPHSASSQMNMGEGIKRADLALGDLIFFKTLRSMSINHVGIYLGNGSFIHAASGSGRIKIDSVDNRYYNSRYWGARRILVYERKENRASK